MALAVNCRRKRAPPSNYKIHITNKRAIDWTSAVRLVAKNLGTTDSLRINMHDRILGLYSA